jgi:hypothetical protein
MNGWVNFGKIFFENCERMEPVESESSGSATRILVVRGAVEMRSTYTHSHIHTNTILERKHERKRPLGDIRMHKLILLKWIIEEI